MADYMYDLQSTTYVRSMHARYRAYEYLPTYFDQTILHKWLGCFRASKARKDLGMKAGGQVAFVGPVLALTLRGTEYMHHQSPPTGPVLPFYSL
jgi:hypothetical protein